MNGSSNNFITYGKQAFSGLKHIKALSLSRLRKVFSLMGKKEKIAILILLLLAATNFLWSLRNFYYKYTIIAPASGGIYTEGMLGQAQYINPLLAHSEADLSLTKLIFSGLYKYDSQGNLVPDLAESLPQISEDQKQYTINLKQNVKWHNDKPFNADDVVFTFQILKDPSYKSPYRGLWLSTNVEKLSDFQVKFTTKDISGPFVHNLTLPILPQSVWSRVEPQNFTLTQSNLEAIGSGPYSVKEIKKLGSGKIQSLALRSFPDYHGGQPKIETVFVKFFESEEDLFNALHGKEIEGFGFTALGNTFNLDPERDELNVSTIPLPQYQVLFFNLSNKFLADKNVRTALSKAVNRQEIIEQIFENSAIPAISTLSKKSSVNTRGSMEEAAQILDAAGYTIDPSTNTRTSKKSGALEITIATNDSPLNSSAAEKIAQQWKNLNIKVNLNVLPTKELTDNLIRPRSFDVLLFPQKIAADPDPFIFWHSSQTKDPGLNLTGLENTEVDKIISEARNTTNQELRQQKYQELDTLLQDISPIVVLNQSQYIYVTASHVKNVGVKTLFEPSHRLYDLPRWYLNEKRIWR